MTHGHKKIIPEADRNVKVNHSHHFWLLDRDDVADTHLLFLAAASPRLTFSVPTGEVAEIATAVTSLWEGYSRTDGGREWAEAAERVGTNHLHARGYLTGDCSTFLRPRGPLGGG